MHQSTFRETQERLAKYGSNSLDKENARIFLVLLPEAEEKFPNQNIVKNTPIPDSINNLSNLRNFFYDKFKIAYENISHNPGPFFNYKPYESELSYPILNRKNTLSMSRYKVGVKKKIVSV